MKRYPPQDTPPTQRRRLSSHDNHDDEEIEANTEATDSSDSPFRPTLQRKMVDICEHGLDEDGFVMFDVVMRWPNNPPRIQAVVVEDGQPVKFEVAFLGPCYDYFQSIGLAFAIKDKVCLSLKGAQLQRKATAANGRLPVTLNYPHGVRLKIISRAKAPAFPGIVDYWASLEKSNPEPPRKKPRLGPFTGDAPFSSDWFVTPAMSAPQDISTTETTTSATSQPKQSLPTSTDAAADEPQTPVPAAHDEPTGQECTSFDPHKAATPPPQPAPPQPKKLYREVPGRPPKGTTNAQKKQPSPTTESSKGPDQTNATPPATTTTKESSKEPGKHASKKAAKKAAREAKKAAKSIQQLEPTEVLVPEQATTREPNPPPAAAQPSTSYPVLEKRPSTHASSPRPHHSSAAASPAPANAEQTSTSSAETPSIPIAGPSRHNSNIAPATTPKPAKAIPAPKASQLNRSVSGAPSASQNPELELEAGCMGQQGTIYVPLEAVRKGNPVSVIGIVAAAGKDSKTSTGEWCRRVMLVDPSNVDPDALEKGFSVNCFAKVPPGLPQCKQGDVLVLHGMQVQHYQGNPTGTCASYSLWSWAVFIPETGKIVRESGAPSSSQDLGQAELKYCIALGDWWRAVRKEQERRESHVVRHQIGEPDAWGQGRARPSIAREHRLIKDATPTMQPNGYFDCTVEVLHGHENNNNRVYSLYVTDYTKNDFLTPMSATWCPPGLAPYVLRLEMWDDAAQAAREMQPHEFYAFDNVKMRVSASGYWEAKWVESRKMRKLDVDELEGEPHLAELLERKKKWEEEAEDGSAHKFPHQLIAEAQLDSHFCCTVEILFVKKKDNDRTLAWVTDYTSRTDLAPIDATADWKRDISDDRILKLALFDEQAKAAADLQPGELVALRNLRLKSLSSGKPSVTGLLGGFERLIYKLNPQTTGDEGCLALLSRKKAYEKRVKDLKFQEKSSAANGKKSGAASKKRQARREPPDIPDDAWPIKEMQASRDVSKHAKYRLAARIVDYYPDSLEDFVMLRCTNCEDDIPEQLRICTRCETDMSETYVQPFYKFWFEVEDTEGTRLRLVVAHPELRRRKQNNAQPLPDFIQDLDPVDFRSEDDDEALEKFRDRLRIYLGDELVDKHSELIHAVGEDKVQPSDSPWLDLIVTVTAGDDPTYLLWKCALLK